MALPRILIQSPDSASGWWRAPEPDRLLIADHLNQVVTVLDEVEAWTAGGGWAFGFLTYEAGPAFDPALAVRSGDAGVDRLPLAWFALSAEPMASEPLPRQSLDEIEWTHVVEPTDYLNALATIHAQIAGGNTYQVNFTVPLRTDSLPEAPAWFAATRSRDPRACQALLEIPEIDGCGPWSIVSLSPELFFSIDGNRIHSRPMKGTARPGRDLTETEERAAALASSEKERAENVMIVDMVRNDLGRIAAIGSVRVPSLFEVEQHPTVLQMTSTVEAETDTSLPEIFAALFPCASITGAPKISTSRIIAELECQPRGIYTGAIGWVAPGRRARFGVAIRTAVIDHRRGVAEYGVGSGVVWDSEPDREYDECLAKAASISHPREEYELLETMLWEPSRSLVLAERHRARLRASARHFGQTLDEGALDQVLADLQQHPGTAPRRIRLTVSPYGEIAVEWHDLDPLPTPLRAAFAQLDVDSDDPRLWHKTTARAIYDRALATHPEADDVLLVNRDGEVTESTLANLVVQIDGRWLTPRRQAGLLDGTLRARLLEAGTVEEAAITPEMVRSADRIYLINSVRGWMLAELLKIVNRES